MDTWRGFSFLFLSFAVTRRRLSLSLSLYNGSNQTTLIEGTVLRLPACPLPGMLLSRGNTSEHVSWSTCPARQSSVMIRRALWHREMLSSARTLMSLLLSHCRPGEAGRRWFIWAPWFSSSHAPRRAARRRGRAGRRAAS